MARYALVAGINQYEHGELSPLQFAEADARRMAALLSDYGFDVLCLTGPQAHRNALLSVFERRRLRPGGPQMSAADQFLLFFSSHGQSLRGNFVLHPYDAQAHRSTQSIPVEDLSACRAAYSYGYSPDVAWNDIGFRIVQTLRNPAE